MPPLESRPGSYYSTESDSDFGELMRRAKSGELDVLEVDDASGMTTYLFAPQTNWDASDLLIRAMDERVVNTDGNLYANRIISSGRKV